MIHFESSVKNECWACGPDVSWVYIDTGERVCENCGNVDPNFRDFDFSAVYDKTWIMADPRRRSIISDPCVSTKGRYREKFHYNERKAQFLMADPPIPWADWNELLNESVKTEIYGPRQVFTRATIYLMTYRSGLRKYRERWKTVLHWVKGDTADVEVPNGQFIEWLDSTMDRVIDIFKANRHLMPQSSTKTGKRTRHNMMSFYFAFRKCFEARDLWQYHFDLTIPRSHTKLHPLDDMMCFICGKLGLKFQRTCIIKRPKIRRKRKYYYTALA